MRSLKLLDYLPKPTTPGFDLASPRAFQVLVALVQHASQLGTSAGPSGQSPSKTGSSSAKSKASQPSTGTKKPEVADPTDSKVKTKRRPAKRRRPSKQKPANSESPQASAVQAVWTVEKVAIVCGCNRNTAGTALKELAALGWIKTGIGRTDGGEYSGFWYALLIPPSELTPAAEHFYTTKVDQTEDRLLQIRQRIKNSTPDDNIPPVDDSSADDGPDKEEAI